MESKSIARVNGEARNHTPIQPNKSENGNGHARSVQTRRDKKRQTEAVLTTDMKALPMARKTLFEASSGWRTTWLGGNSISGTGGAAGA